MGKLVSEKERKKEKRSGNESEKKRDLVVPVLSGHVSPMMNLGQVLGLVPEHVLARPQNILKNPCPVLF